MKLGNFGSAIMNIMKSGSFMPNLFSQIRYSTDKFQDLQLIVRAVSGAMY